MDPWLLWAAAGIVLIVAEMFTLTFFLASFGVAALITSAATAYGLNLNGQLGVFLGSSLLTLVLLRPFFRRLIYPHSDQRKSNHHALIGQVCAVIEPIEGIPPVGRVKVGGEEWRAISLDQQPLNTGTAVTIHSVDSATLTVKAVS